MIVVLASCAALSAAILFLIGLAVQGRVQRYIDDGRILAALETGAPAPWPISRAARAVGNPGRWFGSDSYPPAAMRAGEEGRVRVAIAIDANGAPIGCHVRESSGFAALDQGTCDAIVARGRFSPARDGAGKAVPAIWQSPFIRWKLES